jgi:hypothetical protein
MSSLGASSRRASSGLIIIPLKNFEEAHIIDRVNGTKYIGTVSGSKKHGAGILTCENGSEYKGFFKNDKKYGKGIFTSFNGNIYYGHFLNDEKHGMGMEELLSGDTYEGNFSNNKKNGDFKYFRKASEKTYKVQFVDDEIIGDMIEDN